MNIVNGQWRTIPYVQESFHSISSWDVSNCAEHKRSTRSDDLIHDGRCLNDDVGKTRDTSSFVICSGGNDDRSDVDTKHKASSPVGSNNDNVDHSDASNNHEASSIFDIDVDQDYHDGDSSTNDDMQLSVCNSSDNGDRIGSSTTVNDMARFVDSIKHNSEVK